MLSRRFTSEAQPRTKNGRAAPQHRPGSRGRAAARPRRAAAATSPSMLAHRDRDERRGQRHADPEAPRHVGEFGVGRVAGGRASSAPAPCRKSGSCPGSPRTISGASGRSIGPRRRRRRRRGRRRQIPRRVGGKALAAAARRRNDSYRPACSARCGDVAASTRHAADRVAFAIVPRRRALKGFRRGQSVGSRHVFSILSSGALVDNRSASPCRPSRPSELRAARRAR